MTSIRTEPQTEGGKNAWRIFTQRYGSICDELAFAIGLAEQNYPELFNSSNDFEQIEAAVRWVFECEWDADIDYWYKQ